MQSTPPSSALDSEVLEWLLNDYENAATLTADIAREIATPVTEEEVAAALERLCSVGKASRYIFVAASGTYLQASFEHAAPAQEFWYLASAKGRMAAAT